jgi:hypothetical protein
VRRWRQEFLNFLGLKFTALIVCFERHAKAGLKEIGNGLGFAMIEEHSTPLSGTNTAERNAGPHGYIELGQSQKPANPGKMFCVHFADSKPERSDGVFNRTVGKKLKIFGLGS